MFKYKRVVAVILFILSWGYLIYKLCTYNDYSLLFNNLSNLPTANYLFLFIILLLMPLNIFLEISKWHISVNRLEKQSLYTSFSQVMYGNAGAFFTPYRVGEHPSRAYYLRNKNHFFAAVVLGFIGTLALEIINVGLGLPASVFYFNNEEQIKVLIIYAIIFLLLVIFFMLIPYLGQYLKGRKMRNEQSVQMVDTLSNLNKKYLFNILLLSLLRYIVYSLQFYLTLCFFDIELPISDAIIAIPTYYMLVSVTPSLPIADAAIRGSWAIIIFQAYTLNTPSIAFAAIILWLVNTAVPSVFGIILTKNDNLS